VRGGSKRNCTYEDWGCLLCLVVVPELHLPEEDLRAALWHLPAICDHPTPELAPDHTESAEVYPDLTVAEDDVVAALGQDEELRDHLSRRRLLATPSGAPRPAAVTAMRMNRASEAEEEDDGDWS
jgi:hypothetical protein